MDSHSTIFPANTSAKGWSLPESQTAQSNKTLTTSAQLWLIWHELENKEAK